MKNIEHLSKLVRDGLQQLSNERKPITCETLSQVLATQDGIASLFGDRERDVATGKSGFSDARNGDIQDILMNDTGPSSSDREIEEPVLLSSPGGTGARISHDPTTEQAGHEAHGRFFGQMREAFLDTLIRFESISGSAEHATRFSDLQDRISSSKDPAILGELGRDLVDFVTACLDRADEERKQVSAFIKELRTGLMSMEDQFMSSLEDTRKSFHINTMFDRALQGQMNDIKTSVNLATTIEDTRDFVLTKISTISKAMVHKRKQDEARFEKADHELNRLQSNLLHMKEEIERVGERTKELEQEVLLDELTGIHNRRAYDRRMEEELERFHGPGRIFSLIIFDVDHFKKVNDRYGHHAGDICLKEIINRIKPFMRHQDFLARYGGEEFAVILAGASEDSARNVAEKFRRMVEKICFICRKQEISVTISLGVAEVRPDDRKPEDLFSRADAALYQAKTEGRNRVCLA